MPTSKHTIEYGDFQTPVGLSRTVCSVVRGIGLSPASIIEPTCGVGTFLASAVETFAGAKKAVGIEINPDYVQAARALLAPWPPSLVSIFNDDFFEVDWASVLQRCPEPILVIGNPPWATNSRLMTLNSSNLPRKSNFLDRKGLEAITGKSNFDISEWMLIQLLERLQGLDAAIALLCKTSVARRSLIYAWTHGIGIEQGRIYGVDSQEHFGASVDACLFFLRLGGTNATQECSVYDNLLSTIASHAIGFRDRVLIANLSFHARTRPLRGRSPYTWRSGVKHDCAMVMELQLHQDGYRNGLGEITDLEGDYLYPMLKSSEVAGSQDPRRWMLVTQESVGGNTGLIQRRAPKTWQYLQSHAPYLDRRASSIYRGRPRFSIFGVGDYSFALWKVAISGFYKRLDFRVVGPVGDKPTVLDDTSYFIACQSEEEARYLTSLLNSALAREFLNAFIFWDAKRPITVEVLSRLDLRALARQLGSIERFDGYLTVNSYQREPDFKQAALFD